MRLVRAVAPPALRATPPLGQVRERVRSLHYSLRTEGTDRHRYRAVARIHGLQHPGEMGGREVEALLLLGQHEGDRAWKSFNWDAVNRLHARGIISNPVGTSKSVAFTPDGRNKAAALLQSLFARSD